MFEKAPAGAVRFLLLFTMLIPGVFYVTGPAGAAGGAPPPPIIAPSISEFTLAST